MLSLILITITATLTLPFTIALTSYANEFFSPADVHSSWARNATWAQSRILEDAQWIAGQGPWTVTSKTILPPSNDTHDYASYRPYFWPNCTGVGNTTQLTDEQIYTTCPYENRDGQFNPDVRRINDTGAFSAMSDSIHYNSLAWSTTSDPQYAGNIVTAINTWFLDPSTRMNPHLNYAQLLRGPGEQKGSSVGVLDLKCMSKVVAGVLLLRESEAPSWTQALDEGLNGWAREYIGWLTSAPLALAERAANNNHGSFYFNQLASLQILVGDTAAAKSSIEAYFNGIYQQQITADGDQPLESARTRPYHYRAYNLVAMIMNAKIGSYVGITDTWNRTTASGAGIQAAADYAMNTPMSIQGDDDDDNQDGESAATELELLHPLAAVASIYGDPDGKYAAFLASNDPQYPTRAYYLLTPGLSDSGLSQTTTTTAVTSSTSSTAQATGVAVSNGTAAATSHGLLTVDTRSLVMGLTLGAVSALIR